MSLVNRLIALGQRDKLGDNYLNNYLPIRGKNNHIEYTSVAGSVLGLLIGKELDTASYKFEEFKDECLDELGGLLTDEDILEHIEEIYFKNNALNKASPEFLLLGRQEKETQASKYLSRIFSKLFG